MMTSEDKLKLHPSVSMNNNSISLSEYCKSKLLVKPIPFSMYNVYVVSAFIQSISDMSRCNITRCYIQYISDKSRPLVRPWNNNRHTIILWISRENNDRDESSVRCRPITYFHAIQKNENQLITGRYTGRVKCPVNPRINSQPKGARSFKSSRYNKILIFIFNGGFDEIT